MTLDVLRADDGVLTLRLNRPDKRNALDEVTMLALIGAVENASTDDAVRVIVLEGAGDHFCGGADIVARNTGADPRPRVGSIQRRVPTQAHRLIPLLCSVQVPVVCKVRGWAAGIGFQLALAADFTIAADDAKFWEPFMQRGFTPDSGATWLLPRRVGDVRARELLLLGRTLTGVEAADWGAIHAAVPEAGLDGAVAEIADRLSNGPTVALGLTKWLLHAGAGAQLQAHLGSEAFALELSSRTDDFREGLAAFRDKREPRFDGR
ncbi:MAG TPA: enoyl-CoA hydratase-related protein [Acidimicrobiia bacterium]|nr:enoyl-CoA hydratase-related protein [Acidimicrobiia bacterium]